MILHHKYSFLPFLGMTLIFQYHDVMSNDKKILRLARLNSLGVAQIPERTVEKSGK